MTTRVAPGPDAELIEEEAIAWFVMRQDVSGLSRGEEFKQWLNQSPTHAETYARVARLYADAAILQQSVRFGADRNRSLVPQSLARHRHGLVAAAFVTVIAAAIGLALHDRAAPPTAIGASSQGQVLASTDGAIHRIRLADGSTVTLDSASRMDVSLAGRQRRFALVAGRARLNLVDDGRPFVITAAREEIAGNAALLDIEASGDNGQAVIWWGFARARPLWRQADYRQDSDVLRPAKARLLGPNSVREPPSRDAVGSRDWPNGWAEYRALSLGTLVEVVNSYGNTPLRIDDPPVAGELVSGRFRLTDPDAVAQRLATVFDLVVIRRTDGIHLAAKK